MLRKTAYLLISAALLAACDEPPTSVRPPIDGGPLPAPSALTVPSEPQRVQWRFRLDGDYSLHSPGVGADGTVYVSMSNGKLYAIAPDGTQRWVIQTGQGGGVYGPVSVGSDGTIYVAGLVADPSGAGSTGAIFAITPSGAQKWVFNATKDLIIAGPNVGPDGNIYAVADYAGIGLFSLTPLGQLRFSTGKFTEVGALGQEIAFGSGQLYFAFDMGGTGTPSSLFGYGLNGVKRFQVGGPGNPSQPSVGPNGNVVIQTFPSNVGWSLAAYSPAGAQVWSFYEFPGNSEEHPHVGPDNVAYTVRNLSTLFAFNPNGTVRWRYVDSGIMFQPKVRPLNDVVFVGGRIGYGQPGFFLAVSTSGTPLWRVDLPDEPGFAEYGQLVPDTRPVFSPDGNTAYAVAGVLGDNNSATPYAFLYAITIGGSGGTPPPPPPPANNQPPVAQANGPYSGNEGAAIAFSSAGTSDPNGDALSYLWNFGDGTTSTLANPSKSYKDNGSYTIKLTVTDPAGASGTSSTTATTSNVAPTATWSAPSSITEGSTYSLQLKNGTDAGSADISTLQYRFDCGRGAGWTAWSTTKSLSCAKLLDQLTYKLTIRGEIRDKDGGVRSYSKLMAVTNAPPVVRLTATTATTLKVGTPLGVSGWFTDKGVNDMPWKYAFIWGDGSVSTTGSRNVQGSANTITASHAYSAAGTFYVNLRITDKDGRVGTKRITVTITP